MIALRQWGERWETGVPAFPILTDARDRRPIAAITVRSHDGRPLGKGDLIWAVPGDVERDLDLSEQRSSRGRADLASA